MFMRWVVVLLLVLPGGGRAEEIAYPEDSVAQDEDAVPMEADGDELLEPSMDEEDAQPEKAPRAMSGSRSRWANRLSLEMTTWALLPRRRADSDEGFLQVQPRLEVVNPGFLQLDLSAPVRLRMWGGGEGASLVRKEDWDELSDWGQVVQNLMVGGDAPNFVWVGALESYTLLSGHLVRRYNNRGNPDYHPAGAVVTGMLRPLYVEAFASDVLGARLMGAEVVLDVQHVFFGRRPFPMKYALSLSAVHDWGKAGGTSEPMTLAHLDGTAILVSRRNKEKGFELQANAGWGGRPGEGGAWGAVAGLGAEYMSSTMDMRARLEGRLQRGGFRQGAFGPDYELARFQRASPDARTQADAPFPDGYSAHGEVILSWDAESLGVLGQRHFRMSMGAEVFNWGRVEVDGRMETQLFLRNLSVGVGGVAVGAGRPGARYLVSGDARWRFLGGKLYAVGQAGTLLFPTAEGTLRPGAFASVGLGVDNAR
ncbi:hypothetical protein POL68_24995 [Stigmatella sp. ncwal1]|uniref:DUF5723 domain-containing protein n=1 Tax=Stigmatella ashevillensis TaxID=2995309 RepID=A0ABT5DDJ7_9BACT|nr:hypothetical protein [Stigmatella ashevillena]MDC0711750.1 hypothetical protein [Stigmatella ashevillena]